MLQDRLPSPSSLFVFEAAARTLNFSRAAQELGITQSAVSRAIASLELQLCLRLFARHGPRIALTEDGEALSRSTTAAFRSIDQTISDLQQRDPDRETVLLSISSGMAAHWLIPRLDEFRSQLPRIDLRFELIPGAVGGPLNKCDLGLRTFDADAHAEAGSLFVEELVQPLGSAAYLRARGPLDHADAELPHTLIELSGHWLSWSEYAARCGISLPKNHQILSFKDYSVVLQACIAGQGLALGWISVTSKLLLNKVLLAAAAPSLATGRTFNLIGPSTRPISMAARSVRDWMTEQMRQDIQQLHQHREAQGPTELPLSLPGP